MSYYLLLPAWPDIYSQNFKLDLIAKFYFYLYLIDFKIWKFFLVWYYSCLPTAESSESWVYAGMLRLTSSHLFSNVMIQVGLKSHQRGHRGRLNVLTPWIIWEVNTALIAEMDSKNAKERSVNGLSLRWSIKKTIIFFLMEKSNLTYKLHR